MAITRPQERLIESIRERAGQQGVERISLACTDWNGRLRATQYPIASLGTALREGVPLTTAIFATDSAEQPITTGYFHDPAHGYPDAWWMPDLAAVREDAYTTSGNGLLVLGQLVGDFSDCCPRAILKREVAALAALGYRCRAAFEFEYHVLAETPASLREKVPASVCRLPALERMYSYVDQAVAGPLFDETRAAAEALGVPLHSMHAEFTGLLEAALAPTDALEAADHAVLFKTVAKIVARRQGLLASFMARLSESFESAGGHLNVSLRSIADNAAVFHTRGGDSNEVLRHFLGGLQCHLPALLLLQLPHLNSFKRWLGASFAPQINAWGLDNKTCAYRVVNQTPALARIECRVPGADINPYLALAACLAAGRRGIENQLPPSAPVVGDAAVESAPRGTPFPSTFDAAIAAWRGAEFARATFGLRFVDAYARSREWELAQLARTVTDWELRQYGEGV